MVVPRTPASKLPRLIATLLVIFVSLQSQATNYSVSSKLRNASVSSAQLLRATVSEESARALNASALDQLHSTVFGSDRDALRLSDPSWPIYAYLLAETHRIRGNAAIARSEFRELATWAVGDPYKDQRGGSSLAIMALWRWGELLLTLPNAEMQKEEILNLDAVAQDLLKTPFATHLFRFSILDALPQIRERTHLLRATLLQKVGETDLALARMYDYLQYTTTDELTSEQHRLVGTLLTSKVITQDYVNYLRARNLELLGDHNGASQLYAQVSAESDSSVGVKAKLAWIKLSKASEQLKPRVLEQLDDVIEFVNDPLVAEQALDYRATLHKRYGQHREFLADYERLITEYPDSELVGDAFLEIARYFQLTGAHEQALDNFERASRAKNSDWQTTASYQTGLTLFRRGGPGDYALAAKIFKTLADRKKHGSVNLLSNFWLGRVAEASGDANTAERSFKFLRSIVPYSYYGIRAQMHLNLGARAKTRIWPDHDTVNRLAGAYQKSAKPLPPKGESAYHIRLKFSDSQELYSVALKERNSVTARFASTPLQRIPLATLDSFGRLAAVGLYLSLRQDAFEASRYPNANATERLRIASFLGYRQGDWPMATRIVIDEELYGVQAMRGFLSVAFPPVYKKEIQLASERNGLCGGLIYGLIRRESNFANSVQSAYGASGLLQFRLETFNDLDKKYGLLVKSSAPSATEYLMNPHHSIDLGGIWLKESLLPKFDGNVLFSLMAHNSGDEAVRSWIHMWKTTKAIEDVEFMVETARSRQTRRFLRGVYGDTVVANAALFNSKSASACISNSP